MKSRYIVTALIILAGMLLVAGCTDKTKDNPTRPDALAQGLPFLNNWSFYSIFFSTAFDPGYMVSTAYVPPDYDWQSNSGRPYPVLYMLAPFRGDDRYYFEHGLSEVADRLLEEGKIQPMIIVTVDGRSAWGGSFYTNSTAQGGYFSALTKDTSFLIDDYSDPDAIPVPISHETQTLNSNGLINRMDDWYLTVNDPKARAISGVGMGGYGAFSLALKSGMFGSISAVNAPLDFDGRDGNGGFRLLLNDIGNRWDWRLDTLGIDTIIETSPGVFDTILDVVANHLDTSFADAEVSLVVSAAAAFSPHWMAVQIDSVFDDQFGSQTWGYTPTDSLTGDRSTLLPKHMVHVPFDSSGAFSDPIWNTWLENSIPVLYQNDPYGYASDFLAMPKLLVKSEQAKFHYEDQMDGFIEFLESIGDTHYTVMNFKGNSILTGTADHFLYDILEDILIFHSANFEIPGDIEGD